MNFEKWLILTSLINDITDDNYDLKALNYTFDDEINNCLIKMYLLMIIKESDKNYQKLFDEFLFSYHKLTEEKKEFVRKDFKKIINAQNEQKKVKRKGEIKYE